MLKSVINLITATVLVLSCSLANADLTKKDVDLWVKSMKEITPWLEKNEEALEKAGVMNPENFSSKDAGTAALKKAGLHGDLEKKVKKYGYNSVGEWVDSTQNISTVYMAIKSEAHQAEMAAAKAQMQQLMNTPNMDPQQKAMMQQMMNEQMSIFAMLEAVTKKDKDLVRPHVPELDKIMKIDDQMKGHQGHNH